MGGLLHTVTCTDEQLIPSFYSVQYKQWQRKASIGLTRIPLFGQCILLILSLSPPTSSVFALAFAHGSVLCSEGANTSRIIWGMYPF